MGLDIYAGTLTRYYAHNWKSIVQQWAEENGWGFSRITPEGNAAEEEPEMTPDEIQKDVEDWRDWILAGILQEGREPYTPWREDNEAPYYTDKPDWDAFGALILYAASVLYKEPLPKTVEKNWDYENHPLVKRVMEDEEKNWSLFSGATWWLPIADMLSFRAPTPAEQTVVMATTGALQAELARINELGWQADEAAILDWSRTEGYPADGEVLADGKLVKTEENTQYDTESLAKFAFSMLWQAVRFSMEQQVPILLDY